jgi:hypothetical protein
MEENLHKMMMGLIEYLIHYNLKTSDTKTKGIGLQGKYWQQMKTVINGNMSE